MTGNAKAITAEKGFRNSSVDVFGNAPAQKAAGVLGVDTANVLERESKATSDDRAVKDTADILKDTYEKARDDFSSFPSGKDEKEQDADSLLPLEVTETGRLRFTMRNDYMFKAVFQTNHEALKALLASLLGHTISEITEVRLENPIILGETIEDKTVILDLRVLLNNEESINIEMQVAEQVSWRERTLVYVSRNFSDLNRGEEYDQVKPVIHIGILDFRLDPEDERFYSENVLMDKRTGEVYSEKLQLNELSLKNIENATKEQRESGLYKWAKFFAAATWEELKMAALDSKEMQSAMVTMRKLTADDKVRLQCEARERYNLDLRTWQSALQREKADREKAEAEKQRSRRQKQKAEAEKQKAEKNLNAMLELMSENPSLSAAEILDRMRQKNS